MGYESKLYVTRTSNYGELWFNEKIAMIDLCKMGYDLVDGKCFRDIFKLPLHGHLGYEDVDGEIPITEDCYGSPIEGAKISDVIEWMEQHRQQTGERYWREDVCIKVLKAFADEPESEDLVVYHFGY